MPFSRHRFNQLTNYKFTGDNVFKTINKILSLAVTIILIAITVPALSQADKITVKEGTEVELKFSDDITSKTAVVDDRVNFTLSEDLKVDNITIAKAGAIAVGTVTAAKKAGMMGKGGELSVRLDYFKVGDTKVHLRANKGKEGDDKTGSVVALTILFGPIGLIKHGKNVEVKAGTPLKAYVDEDTQVIPSK